MRGHFLRAAAGNAEVFPVIEAANTYTSSSSNLSPGATFNFSITLPPGLGAGDVWVVSIAARATSDMDLNPTLIGGGGSILREYSSGLNSIIYTRAATSSSGTTQTIRYTNDSAFFLTIYLSYVSYRFSGVVNGVFAAIYGTTINDPPSATAPWGSANNIFVACATGYDSSDTYTAAPSGYQGFLNANNGGVQSATCYLQSTNATEDPGVFTSSPGTVNPRALTTFVVG